MATMTEVYSDIDVSLEKNSQKDFPKLININAIRQALYNRMMISSSELPFDNSERLNIRDFIHSDISDFDDSLLVETVERAAMNDSRLSNIDVSTSQVTNIDGTVHTHVKIVARVNYDNGLRQNVDFTFILDNN